MSGQSSARSRGRYGRIRDSVLLMSPGLLVVLYVLNTGSSADPFLTRLSNAAFLGVGVQALGSLAYFIVAGLIGHLKGDEIEKSMEAARLYWLPAVLSMALVWMWMDNVADRNLESIIECIETGDGSYQIAYDALRGDYSASDWPEREIVTAYAGEVSWCAAEWAALWEEDDEDDY